MTKALVPSFRSLLGFGNNKQSTHHAPYHWHMTPFKTKYPMRYVGYNNRTKKKVYQCTFCGGKAERRH